MPVGKFAFGGQKPGRNGAGVPLTAVLPATSPVRICTVAPFKGGRAGSEPSTTLPLRTVVASGAVPANTEIDRDPPPASGCDVRMTVSPGATASTTPALTTRTIDGFSDVQVDDEVASAGVFGRQP